MNKRCCLLFFPALLILCACGVEQPHSELHQSSTGLSQTTRKLFSVVSRGWLRTRIASLWDGDQVEAVEELIAKGADVNGRDSKERTPLHLVRDWKTAWLLLHNGADPNAKANGGITPLHVVRIVKLASILVNAEADVNAQDIDGNTPLHWATNSHRWWIALRLLRLGADLHIENNRGETPLDMAKRQVAELQGANFKLFSEAYRQGRAEEMENLYLRFAKATKEGASAEDAVALIVGNKFY